MKTDTLSILQRVQNGEITPQVAQEQLFVLFGISKRYFLFECVNVDKQRLNKLIIADDKESAIADLETSYPYIERWYTIEELNVC